MFFFQETAHVKEREREREREKQIPNQRSRLSFGETQLKQEREGEKKIFSVAVIIITVRAEPPRVRSQPAATTI